MTLQQHLANNLTLSHQSFSGTVADLTQAMTDWTPPGLAHPIGERYAHAVLAEDWLFHAMVTGTPLLAASSWAGKTGFGELDLSISSEAARDFRVDLDALHKYREAVFADTEKYLGSASDEEMARFYDMSSVGMAQVPAPEWWLFFIIEHVHEIMGEISALKGLQGAKGYPF